MSTDMMHCAGCLKTIKDRKYLFCGGCKQFYDLDCANVSDQRFYNTLTREHKENWRCVICKGRQPKVDNTDTPVRAPIDGVTMLRGTGHKSPMQLDVSMVDQSHSTIDCSNDNNNVTTHFNQTIEMTDMQSFLSEMRVFRAEMRDEMRATRLQLELMNETLSSLSNRVLTCEGRIARVEERANALENHIRNNTDGPLSATIAELRMELNDRDQDMLLNDVEISCIQEEKGEPLMRVVSTLASKLGVELAEQDIVSVMRVGRVVSESAERRPRPIVVRLARRAVRDRLLQAARVRRGATTEGADLPGPPRPFYVNERLTKLNRQLFRRARDLGNRLNWRFVWTKDGRIYVRQYQNKEAPRIRLRCDEDLSRVFGAEAVGS